MEKVTYEPDFWQDQNKAQSIMKQLVETRKIVEKWRNQEKRLTDASELLVLAEKDDSIISGLQSEVDQAAALLEQMEFELAFSGKFDDRNAILSIHAGAGGTESQDWADMLLRMFLRWAERRGYKAEILDISPGRRSRA